MSLPDKTSYLAEAMKGGYDYESEDRLSQVFSASFNHSATFRRLFYSFAKIKSLSNPRSITQQCEKHPNNDGRLDICLYDGNALKVIIENKIDAPLYIKQLSGYSKMHPSAKKIAMVKNFFEPFADRKGWRILHWGDLYRHIVDKRRGSPEPIVDGFVVDNFLCHMEEVGLKTVTRISRDELTALSRCVHEMRKPRNFKYSLQTQAFDVATRYLQMIENIIEMSKENDLIRKSVNKNYRFAPWIGNYFSDVKDAHHDMIIFADIRLKRRNHRVANVGTGIFFTKDNSKKVRVVTYWQKKGEAALQNETDYRGKDLVFDDYAKQVLT